MEEEFYATIKLTSGEELISKICYLPEEDSIILDTPMLVEKIVTKKTGVNVEGFVLKEWILATYDTMFIIKMEQIITLSELDKKIETFYLKHLSGDIESKSDEIGIKPKDFSRRMGYLGSVKETKEYLEDIFNRS